MARSPGFGSAPYYSSRPLKTRFRFGSVLSDLTSHHGTTRRFILQKARHHPLTGSDFFQAHGFRFSFTPLPRFFSPFPHGTLSLSLTRLYLALADGPACFRQDSSCLAVLRVFLASASDFAYRAFTFFGRASVHVRLSSASAFSEPLQPHLPMVWASPLSLAATRGITFVFFSSGYLDVSVPRVPLSRTIFFIRG